MSSCNQCKNCKRGRWWNFTIILLGITTFILVAAVVAIFIFNILRSIELQLDDKLELDEFEDDLVIILCLDNFENYLKNPNKNNLKDALIFSRHFFTRLSSQSQNNHFSENIRPLFDDKIINYIQFNIGYNQELNNLLIYEFNKLGSSVHFRSFLKEIDTLFQNNTGELSLSIIQKIISSFQQPDS